MGSGADTVDMSDAAGQKVVVVPARSGPDVSW